MSVFLVLLGGGCFLDGRCLNKSESFLDNEDQEGGSMLLLRIDALDVTRSWFKVSSRFGHGRAGKSSCQARLISLPWLQCFLGGQGSCPDVVEGSCFYFFYFLCIFLFPPAVVTVILIERGEILLKSVVKSVNLEFCR